MAIELSFTKRIKEELCSKKEENKFRELGILSSYIKINGCLRVNKGGDSLLLKTSDAKIAKYLYFLLNKHFSSNPRFVYEKSKQFNNTIKYNIIIEKDIDVILDKLQIDFLSEDIPEDFIKNEQMTFGYLEGAFLSSGSCNSPESSNYHLEYCFNNADFATSMLNLINSYQRVQFNIRITKRRSKYILYLKKSDLISNFLIIIGAVICALDFESIRIDRDFSNSENRLLNLDGANMEKTIEANKKQIKLIKKLDDIVGISHLQNEKLKIYCTLRLNNVEPTMKELAEMMSKQMGVYVSKSNVYHLSKKIEEMVASGDDGIE